MKKQNKQQKTNLSLKEFLNNVDQATLRGAALSFEGSLGWDVMKAYIATVQRRYEVDALDMMGKDERDPRSAAYASGYAKACEEFPAFIDGLNQTILGKSQIVENDRPEE